MRNLVLVLLLCFSRIQRYLSAEYFLYKGKTPAVVKELETSDDLLSLINSPDEEAQNNVHFVIFYSFWCPHCVSTSVLWIAIAKYFSSCTKMKFYGFECVGNYRNSRSGTANIPPSTLCEDLNAKTVPTVNVYIPKIYLGSGKKKKKFEASLRKNFENDYFVNILISVEKYAKTIAWIKSAFENELDCDLLATDATDEADKDTQQVATITNGLATPDSTIQTFPAHSIGSPDARLYDAILAFGFILRNWTPKEFDVVAYSRLLQLILMTKELIPGQAVSPDLVPLIVYIKNCLKKPLLWSFTKYQNLLDETYINGVDLPPSGTSPEFLASINVTNGIWMFFHIISIATLQRDASSEAVYIINKFLNKQSPDTFQLDGLEDTTAVVSHQDPLNNSQTEKFLVQNITTSLRPYSSNFSATPENVSVTILNTVESFFGCEDCRLNFIYGYKNCYGNRCQWLPETTEANTNVSAIEPKKDLPNEIKTNSVGLILWLWYYHNLVSLRVSAEKKGSRVFKYVQEVLNHVEVDFDLAVSSLSQIPRINEYVPFPSKEMCRDCNLLSSYDTEHMDALVVKYLKFETRESNTTVNWPQKNTKPFGTTVRLNAPEPEDQFNLVKVLEFLLEFYWKPEWLSNSIQLVWSSNMIAVGDISDSDAEAAGGSPISRAEDSFTVVLCCSLFGLAVFGINRMYRKSNSKINRLGYRKV